MAVMVVLAVPLFVTEILLECDCIPTYVLKNASELGLDVICAETGMRSPPASRQLMKQKRTRRMATDISLSSDSFGLWYSAGQNNNIIPGHGVNRWLRTGQLNGELRWLRLSRASTPSRETAQI